MRMAEIEAYVCQSQLIEGIEYTKSKQLSSDHIAATEYVLLQTASGLWPDVRVVHRILATSFLSTAGSFRSLPVYVASAKEGAPRTEMPAPQHVSQLMEYWERCSQTIRRNVERDVDRESSCFALYYILLCIHPFEDGNGRVARLMCNAARVLCGLPWYTFTADVHPLFVGKLRTFEKETFRPTFEQLYDTAK
jgi:Fic family protein